MILYALLLSFAVFFFNDTATTLIYTLSLHDALPICGRIVATDILAIRELAGVEFVQGDFREEAVFGELLRRLPGRSEEHTSELQSHHDLVCRLLLEKKKLNITLQPPPLNPIFNTSDS